MGRRALDVDGPWLLRVDGHDVGPLVVASSARARAVGLLGHARIEGALLLVGVRSVHGVGLRIPLDVAGCDADLVVCRVAPLLPGRILLPSRGVRHTLEAAAGSFAAWAVVPGASLAIVRRP